jgi:hypothetical protein
VGVGGCCDPGARWVWAGGFEKDNASVGGRSDREAMRIWADAAIKRQCGFGRAASRGQGGFRREEAGFWWWAGRLGHVSQRPGSGMLFRLDVLASHRPSLRQGWWLARTKSAGTPDWAWHADRPWCVLKSRAGECFRIPCTCAKIRSLRAPVFCSTLFLVGITSLLRARPYGSWLRQQRRLASACASQGQADLEDREHLMFELTRI